jgi:hypothetical protein
LDETQYRSLVKTLTWRVTGSFATFLIAWIIGGDLAVAVGHQDKKRDGT